MCRQVYEFQELEVLAPVVRLALVVDLPVDLLPVADGGEKRRITSRGILPKINDDGLARRLEIKQRRLRQRAIRSAEIFAEGKTACGFLAITCHRQINSMSNFKGARHGI